MEWILKYISVTAILGGLWLMVRHLIQVKINSYFNKKLEDHKHALQILTETTVYNLNKKMFDFQAYATKKHEVYPELYKQLFTVWSLQQDFAYKRGLGQDFIMLEPIQMKIKEQTLESITYYSEVELYLSEEVSKKALAVINSFAGHAFDLYDIPFDEINVNAGTRENKDVLNTLKKQLHEELAYSHFEN